MAKIINCSDMGSDCTFVARGETLEEVLAVGAEHGKEVHGITEITPEMIEIVKGLVRDE
jgi:predicted small metal-binding protein